MRRGEKLKIKQNGKSARSTWVLKNYLVFLKKSQRIFLATISLGHFKQPNNLEIIIALLKDILVTPYFLS